MLDVFFSAEIFSRPEVERWDYTARKWRQAWIGDGGVECLATKNTKKHKDDRKSRAQAQRRRECNQFWLRAVADGRTWQRIGWFWGTSMFYQALHSMRPKRNGRDSEEGRFVIGRAARSIFS